MTEQENNRRLAAIMVTDIAGYSSLMQSDEAATFVALGTMRGATEQLVRKHRGRIANTAGDSILAEFTSAVEAVDCALALQAMLPQRGIGSELRARIGIHLGDVLERNGDLFGTAVNVAARLEGIAEPGGIIVSAAIRDAVIGKPPASFSDLGVKALKNIEEPLRVYALSPKAGSLSRSVRSAAEGLPLPNKPSIAVLPFDNMSSDREQEYFADGVVEDIITALSRFRGLFVIARNSSFVYKGQAVNVREVGRELGVRYVLEGSVRKAGSRLRITGQLIDTATGAHLWADRFDGALDDVFDLQDQLTASVVGAIAPKMEEVEIERAKRKPTENLDAYDYYLRGLAAVHQWTKEENDQALSNLYRAIELDPKFASAYGMAARCYTRRQGSGWIKDHEVEVRETARLATLAAELGKDDAVALCTAGVAFSFMVGDHATGKLLTDRALALNPNMALAWLLSGWVRVWLGEYEEVVDRISRSLRLNPADPHSYSMHSALAFAHFFAGRYAEALSWAEMAVREKPFYLLAACIVPASHALAGRPRDAERAIARVRKLDPTLRLSNLNNLIPIGRPEDFANWKEGLRLAGLSE